MHGGALRDEAGALAALGDVVVLLMRERSEIVGAGLDRGGFEIGRGVSVVGFDDTHVIEEKLVAAGVAEHALFEEHAHLGRGALVIVGVNFNDERHFMRRVALEHDVLEGGLVAADAGAFGDGALDDVSRHARFAGLFHRGEKPGVGLNVRSAELGGDGHFFNEFADNLTLLEVDDCALSVEPLTSHRTDQCATRRAAINAEACVPVIYALTVFVSGSPIPLPMQRRAFLKTTLAASAASAALAAGLKTATAAEPAKSPAPSVREYYELRAYRLKAGAPHALLDAYLEKALIPALNARGIATVGVFTEPEAKDGPAVWVLIPHATLESFTRVAAELNTDPVVQQAAGEYLQAAKANPAFDRIDTWLHLAFTGLPKMTLPEASRARGPRVFELRVYESFSEAKALAKVDMFNSGEIDVMREVGLAPVFYGQALAGRDLPHLAYMLSGPDRAAHKAHWDVFRKHPVWEKMKNDPRYADTVSKVTSRMLEPTAYSQM